ncbi:MAG TPA: ABC transporter ATP-binding protein [Myxococcota bacterium]|nr:ABC transporter ATP-binding protein [Myxococcota bacterium]
MIAGLRERPEMRLAGVLTRADRTLAFAWWAVLVARGLLPALQWIAMGALVSAAQSGAPLGVPLGWLGTIFVALLVLAPIHLYLGSNLGSRTAGWLYDQLARACVLPPGMGHLENPSLASDFTMARDFDMGVAGPPLHISMDFIAGALVDFLSGLILAMVLFGYAWWAPPLLIGAWLATHYLLRESAVWRDRQTDVVRQAQRHAEYAYRLAVDPPAAKELRLFGLADWTIERFRSRRRLLHELQYQATRLRERPLVWSLLIVAGANAWVFWSMGTHVADGSLPLAQMITFAGAAASASRIAFGGLSWALDGAAAPVVSVLHLEHAMPAAGTLLRGTRSAAGLPAREIRFRKVTFRYPAAPANAAPVLEGLDLVIPAGSSLAIVGVNGAGKTTLAKLLCRLYDPQSGRIEVDGVDLRELEIESWRARVTAVFQDFIRFELPLRDNVAPHGAPDTLIRAALAEAGAEKLASLDTVLARGYPGGTDLSGGQWQRVALARALCSVRQGAGLVLLDEPTAQLDVRGEAEIFERVLSATRRATTILISHRFSTVRHADRICVLEHGKVVELGSHEQLLALGGRYKTMFELQASRFGTTGESESEESLDALD